MRKTVALIVAAGCIAVLAGCSPTQDAASCVPAVSSGDASKLIASTGKVGVAPTVTFPTPVIATDVEATTLTTGTGKLLEKGAIADVQVSVYVGKTGDFLAATAYDATQPLRMTVGTADNVIADSIQCQTVGSRVASTVSVADMASLLTVDPSLGLTDTDTLVLVTDVAKGYLAKANGTPQILQAGFPSIVTAPDGTPGVTLNSDVAPTDLRIETVLKGDGAVVKDGDSVVTHYTGIDWDTASVFKTSWTTGQPATFTVAASPSTDTTGTGIPTGLSKALIGQTVGSQVLAVIPADEGFSDDALPDGVAKGSTIVFVLDILGIQ